jgi:hypothetical protein
MTPDAEAPGPAGRTGVRFLPRLRKILFWAALAGFSAWCVPAISWSNLPVVLRPVGILVVLGAEGLILYRMSSGLRRTAALAGVAAVVIGLWSCIPPSNDRDWQPDVAVLPYAEVHGNQVTVHRVRNCEYRSGSDFDVRHEDRTYDLSRLRSLDFFVVYWSSPAICHTMLSFGFDDGKYLCLSVETRKEKGEDYSAIKGFFRQYELIYVLADERDLVRLRTNFRDEQVYLYRLRTEPDEVRAVFLDTMNRINSLRARPEWYNALTHNCTSNLRDRTAPYARKRVWSWKFVLNGYIDGLVYDRGALDQSLPFEELKRRSLINQRAKAADGGADFSARIREGLPGMGR